MILRILAYAPLTTKGAELTWEELDGNLIKIFQDLSAKVKAGSIADFDSATVYSLGDASNYDDRTWLYLNAAPAAGIDPGSDPASWAEIDPTFFIHEKNKDTMLAKGTLNEVNAAEIRTLIDSGGALTLYSGNGTLGDDRLVLGDGHDLIFQDLKNLGFQASELISVYAQKYIAFDVPDAPPPGGNSSLSFNLIGSSNDEKLINIYNGADDIVRLYGTGCLSLQKGIKIGENSAIEPGVAFEVISTTEGTIPFPKMEPVDRGLIPSPRVGMLIHNNAIGYPEINHEIYGWQSVGYGTIRITVDFSVTPLTILNSYTVTIPTKMPAGKIIHKMVTMGNSAPDPGSGESYEFGMDSDTTYFQSNAFAINSKSGDVSLGNSNRTLVDNENLNVHYAGETGTINTGSIELTIFHT